LTLLAAIVLLGSAACSLGAAPSSSPAATDVVINVTLSDDMRIEPASMAVPVGVPVRFVIANAGAIEHEFFLGDEAAQQEHEAEMAHGGMGHDDPNGVLLQPGETRELIFTFAAGQWLAGCHVPGHYPAGMKATISVQP
jgi:uncharacterized cupredoxin-like copper-binding protein